jgi:hypothetical protein
MDRIRAKKESKSIVLCSRSESLFVGTRLLDSLEARAVLARLLAGSCVFAWPNVRFDRSKPMLVQFPYVGRMYL